MECACFPHTECGIDSDEICQNPFAEHRSGQARLRFLARD